MTDHDEMQQQDGHESSHESSLFVLGDNRLGQAGVGGEELLTSPIKVDHIGADEVRRIVSNSNQTFAILFNGGLLSSGDNENGELCRPGKRSIFQRIDMLETFKIIDVAAGEDFFHFLCQNGQLLSYGKNDMGQLGNGNREKKEKPRVNQNIKEPLIQISCGLHHTVALTKTGQVLTWGGNRKGQLGDGQLTSSISPIPLVQLRHRPVTAIACGEYHTVIMTSGGSVYSWGGNDHGQLGVGDTTARLRPELIRSLRANKTTQIACGRNHTLFVASNHLLFAAGSNTHGQCGQELAFRQVLTPTVVEFFREKITVEVSCGGLHSFVIASTQSNSHKRRLYVMGSNACGQLGLDSSQSTEYPQLSSYDANQIEAIFTSPLSLTSYILSRQNIASAEALSAPQLSPSRGWELNKALRINRVRPLPSVNDLMITSMLQRLPKDPNTIPANQRSLVDQQVRELRETISAAFSSIAVLNASFLVSPSATTLVTNQGASPLCVDLYAVRHAYEAIMAVETTYPAIVVTLGRTLVHICDELKQCPFDDAETLSVFFILLENPLLLRMRDYHIVLEKLVQSILSLPKTLRVELFKRMKSYPSEFFGRVVSMMMQFLHFILTNKVVGLDTTPVIWVLETLYTCSMDMENIVPYQRFHHPTLPLVVNLLQEWQRFQESRSQHLSQVVNYWQYPFLIDEAHKFQVLQAEYQRKRLQFVHQLVARYDVSRVLTHLLYEHQHRAQEPAASTAASQPPQPPQSPQPPSSSSDAVDSRITSPGSTPEVPMSTNATSHPTDAAAPSSSTSTSATGSTTDMFTQQLQAYLPRHVKAILSERLSVALTPSAAGGAGTLQVSYTISSLVLHLLVRRSHLLQDFRHILSSLLEVEPDALWLPLKVEFAGELGEDVGGLTKELFTLTIRQLMQETSVFALSSSGQVYWFTGREAATEAESEGEKTASTPTTKSLISWEYMLGLVQSLAIYHGIHIDMPLPTAVYKLLKGRELTLSDLAAADRDLAHGLRLLLQYPEGSASIEDAFGVTFVASSNPLLDAQQASSITTATTAVVPLVPRGEEKLVTRGNRQDFVNAFVRHSLYGCCARQVDLYLAGVKRLVGDDLWSLCSHEELETVTAGLSLTEPLTNMRPTAKYVGQFTDDHPVIQWFWDIVGQFTLAQKKQFLLFVSGIERAPIGGVKQLVLTIQSTEQDEHSLPSSRTCFSLLFLSRHYSSRDMLKEKLLTALEHSQGFGLI